MTLYVTLRMYAAFVRGSVITFSTTNKRKQQKTVYKKRCRNQLMSSKLAINSASIPINMLSLSFNAVEWRRSSSTVRITTEIPCSASCANQLFVIVWKKTKQIEM